MSGGPLLELNISPRLVIVIDGDIFLKLSALVYFCLSNFLFFATYENSVAQSPPASRISELSSDSPFIDKGVVYLEADQLISNEDDQSIVAEGHVFGRYQDKALRADKVTYFLKLGKVIAMGNVSLISPDGSVQFADAIELSEELETGTAYNFSSRLPNGGLTGARIARKGEDGGIELYNAYYTACEPCEESKDSEPSWQIKAKRVSQDTDRNLILYQDAVFELFGVPVFYSPYLAHPDPSQDRANGWLNPYGGYSSSRGIFIETPYYFKLDDYSELTLTPHFAYKVNPLLELDYKRNLYSGDVSVNSSFTFGSQFDNEGNVFSNDSFNQTTENPPVGKRIRSHFFADGEFRLADNWDWGFTVQLASDDLYLRRYGLEQPGRTGLYDGGSLRLISQIFSLGQSDDFRLAIGSYGFQSLRTSIIENSTTNLLGIISEDDDTLPVVTPKIEASYHLTEPIANGRMELFGDFSVIARDRGHDYRRGTIGLNYNNSFVFPGGFEAKPFGEIRHDRFELKPYDFSNNSDFDDVIFDRTIGQVGVDIRWPFIKSTKSMHYIVEPRLLITESFGRDKVHQLRPDLDGNGTFDLDFLQDSIDIDFDHNLIWDPNKSTGYDLWQSGTRADFGGAVTALKNNSHMSIFLGQSFTQNASDVFDLESGLVASEFVIDPTTGQALADTNTGQFLRNPVNKSDMVGQFELSLSNKFLFDTRFRYDDDENKFRRLDTGFSYYDELMDIRARYYKIDRATTFSEIGAPAEEITAAIGINVTNNWRLSYNATRDLESNTTRSQAVGIGYKDCCTKIELLYNKYNFQNDIVRQSESIGFRISLLTLGQFGGDNREEF